MSVNKIEEILQAKAGEVVTVEPDLVLITNGHSHGVMDLFKGNPAKKENVKVFYDHNIPAGSSAEAKVCDDLLAFSKEHGFEFIQGKGIALNYLMKTWAEEGKIAVTSSRQASMFGAKGALGIRVSNTELARIIEKGNYSVEVPETIKVSVEGELAEGVDMMDAAMYFLSENKDIEGKVVEFIAPDLCIRDRAVLCAMAGNGKVYTAFAVEEGDGDRVLDLSKVEAMVTLPCDSLEEQVNAQVASLDSCGDVTFKAGQIGGYCGGDIRELRHAAELIKGKKLKRGFRLSVNPATSQDYLEALNEGIITTFIDYGAQIQAAGERSEVSQGAGIVGDGENLITTGLYTYDQCMGEPGSKVYTGSVDSVMKASMAE